MSTRIEGQSVERQEPAQYLQRYRLPFFPWPTSQPGPYMTPPPPGEMPVPTRTDQMVVIDYNQEKGYRQVPADIWSNG